MDLNTENQFNIMANTDQNNENTHKETIKELLKSHNMNKRLQSLENHYELKIDLIKGIMYEFFLYSQTIDRLKFEFLRFNKKDPVLMRNNFSLNATNRSILVDNSFLNTIKQSKTNNRNKIQNIFYLPKVSIDIDNKTNKKYYVRSLSRRNTESIQQTTTQKLLSKSIKHETIKTNNSFKSFKFEPKKRNLSLSQLYSNSNLIEHPSEKNRGSIKINVKIEHKGIIKPIENIIQINNSNRLNELFSFPKYEKIQIIIVRYIGKNKNPFKNINHTLRRAYILYELDTIEQKILIYSSSLSIKIKEREEDPIITKMNQMEIEICIHNKNVLNTYLNQNKNY